jgi:hypothetical protein
MDHGFHFGVLVGVDSLGATFLVSLHFFEDLVQNVLTSNTHIIAKPGHLKEQF